MKGKRQKEIRLGKLELEIMKAVWDRSQATVHEVREALMPLRNRAYSTILTMMRKLEAKGYLRHDVDERTYVYQPTISRDEVRQSLLADLVDRVFDGSARLVVCGLMDQKKISVNELDAIRKLVGKS